MPSDLVPIDVIEKFDDYCTTQYNLAKTKADGDLIHPIIHTGCKKRKASQKMALH